MPRRPLTPALFGAGRFPCLFLFFFWTVVLLLGWGPPEFKVEMRRLLGSPRLPILLSLACLALKAFKEPCLKEGLRPCLPGTLRTPHLNPASLCKGQLVQGISCSQHLHLVLEVLFLQLLQVSPLAVVVKSLTLVQSLAMPQKGHFKRKTAGLSSLWSPLSPLLLMLSCMLSRLLFIILEIGVGPGARKLNQGSFLGSGAAEALKFPLWTPCLMSLMLTSMLCKEAATPTSRHSSAFTAGKCTSKP